MTLRFNKSRETHPKGWATRRKILRNNYIYVLIVMFTIGSNVNSNNENECDKIVFFDNKKLNDIIDSPNLESICDLIAHVEIMDSSVNFVVKVKNDSLSYDTLSHHNPKWEIDVDTLTNVSIILLVEKKYIEILLNTKLEKGKHLIYYDANKISKYINNKRQYKLLTIIGNKYDISRGLLLK